MRNSPGEASLARRLLNFVKVEHTIFSIPLLFAGAYLGAGRHLPSVRVLGLIVLAGIGARALGMAVNRIVDRKFDALNPRTAGRELVSGALSLKQGGAVAAGGLALYLLACALLGGVCLKLAWVPLVPLLGYSFLKRFTPLCHFGIGLVLACAPLGAFVAAAGHTQFDTATWGLALFAAFWISGFDIIYALADLEVDRQIGVRSVPAALGPRWAQVVAGLSHSVAFVGAVLAFRQMGGTFWGLLALGLLAVCFALAYLPVLPPSRRFFPLSAVAGIAGALVPILGGL